MNIDLHHHFFPEEFIGQGKKLYPDWSIRQDAQGRRWATYPSGSFPLSSPEERLTEMDALGIDIAVIAIPGINNFLSSKDLGLYRLINDYLSDLAKQYPQRFKSLAMVPLDDVGLAIEELGRAIEQKGMSGIALGSNILGRPLDSPEFLPFFEEVNRRGLAIILHPGEPAGSQVMRQHNLITLVGFPFETSLAATRLVLSGYLERFPNINLVLPHLGGAVPYLLERVDFHYWEHGGNYPGLSQAPSLYLKKLYYDTAIGYHMPALRCAYESVGADHLVFGTDYPFGFITGFTEKTIASLEKLGLSAEQKEKIYSANALKILK